MRKSEKPVKIMVLKFLLLSGLFLYMLSPWQAEASEESSIRKAKGYGFMGLIQIWEDKNVKGQVYSKYEDGKEVVGFYTKDWITDNTSHDSLKANSKKITGVATFSYNVNTQGKLIGTTPKDALKVSWNNNVETLALVHNLSSSGFNRQLIHSILSDPGLRTKTISNIYKTLIKNGYDGVNIDFENISPKDRELLTGFMAELKAKLSPDGLKVTISVPAKTWDNPKDEWSGAFDYRRLADSADRLMLMTYDEHWLGGLPGPVASQPWVEKVAAYSSVVVPKEKILLGIGNYGYIWTVGRGGHKSVPSKSAIPLALNYGAEIKWDDTSQTPYFYYWNNYMQHVVWFESTNSAAFKLDMVKKYGLGGIAIWKLGFEASNFWDMVHSKFNQTT